MGAPVSPRQRRLQSDADELKKRFGSVAWVDVQPIGPEPAERYRLIFRVPSLRLDNANRPVKSDMTVVELSLPSGYPKEKPYLIAKESVFHPNFGDYVCIADFWSPSQSLADIVREVGEMLVYEKYNIQSPLNAIAADWAVRNPADLPLATIDEIT